MSIDRDIYRDVEIFNIDVYRGSILSAAVKHR